MDYNEKLLIRSLFDEKIRSVLVSSVTEEMFKGKIELAIFNYFKTLSKDKIDDLNTFLLKTRSGLSDSDIEILENVYNSYSEYVCEDFESAIKELEKIVVNKRLINTFDKNLKENNKQLLVDEAFCSRVREDVEFEVVTEKTLFDFTDQEDLSLIGENLRSANDSVVRSKFDTINRSLNAGGYVKGDLVCIAASSGTGKSTLAIDEAINFIKQGKKVLYVTLGDMRPSDTLIRMLSNLAEIEQREARVAWNIIVQEHQDVLKNFKNLVLDAGEVSIHNLLGKITRISRDFKPDVIFVDYDANIYNVDNSHMYDYYGMVYTKLKMYAMTRDVVMFILSQIKITEYSKEIIEKESLEGSSKKQNQLDLLITLGRSQKSGRVGTMNLAKVRNGVSRYQRVSLDHWKCSITEIDDEEYQDAINESQNYTVEQLFSSREK